MAASIGGFAPDYIGGVCLGRPNSKLPARARQP